MMAPATARPGSQLKREIDALTLPDGVHLVPTYDRSELIEGSIATLRDTLIKEGIIVLIVSLVFLMHDTIELAVGGMPISTVVDGRARFSVNLRYGAAFRDSPEALRALPITVAAITPMAEPGAGFSGRGSSGGAAPTAMASGGGMAGMGSGMAGGGAGPMQAGSSVSGMAAAAEPGEDWPQRASVVPLSALASVEVVSGPPMIKNENGQLVGYVFADIDASQRDLGGWVEEARARVDAGFVLPPGYRLQWTGQYEFMAEMQARLRIMIPLTLGLIVGLLFLALRGWGQTWLVLLSVPFAVVGSIWLLAVLDYNLSTAVWVGLIAVGGVAAQTVIVVIVYLDEALRRALEHGGLQRIEDVDAAVVEGAVRGMRPMLMTVATTVLGLLPLLWEGGVGADLSARTAAPVVGGMLSALVLTLLVLPAAYASWRRRQWQRGVLTDAAEVGLSA
jgi:copper/silver efflux system protein